MNIRTVTNPISPLDKAGPEEVRQVKTDHSHQDRDADGRRQKDENKEDHSPLSEEEKKAVELHLKKLDGFVASGLSFAIEKSGDKSFYVIRDQDGNTVRRVPEYEMRTLIQDKDRKSGYLLDRAG